MEVSVNDGTQTAEGEGAVPFEPVQTAAAWTAAAALAESAEWVYRLTQQDVEELLAATQHALATGKDMPDLTAADFPLPTLGARLAQMARAALHGRGFQLLRGFPVHLPRREVLTAYFGLGTYWGAARSQNARGHVVGHVKDLGLDPNADNVRVYATRIAQPWHVDTCDLVSLLCLKRAKSGGRSAWVSSLSIYNKLLDAGRRDLVEELMKPFFYDRKGEVPPGQKGYFGVPVLGFYKGYLTVYYNDRMCREAQRFPEVPRLTPKQQEALQAVTDLANSPELHLEWDLEPGDVQLLHNWNQLHMRTAFEDHPDPEARRHLLRLHLSHPEARPLDPAFFGSDPPGARLGVYTADTRHTAPLEAE